jgi:hypothetical protein
MPGSEQPGKKQDRMNAIKHTDLGRRPTPENFTQRQLELFAIRCSELADRVAAGNLPFLDAVDMAYLAADFAGLVEVAGDDAIQKIMFAAFSRGA